MTARGAVVAALVVAACSGSPPDLACESVVATRLRCEPTRMPCQSQDDRDYCATQARYYRPDVGRALAACHARTDLACTGSDTLVACDAAAVHAAPVSAAARTAILATCQR